MSVPNVQWLDKSFVSTVLLKDLGTSEPIPTVDGYKYDFACETGENYSSILYRLKVHYHLDNKRLNEKSYIVKCMQPLDTDMGKTMRDLGIFEKEYKMYGETIMKMQELVQSAGITFELAPKLIHTITEPVEVLVIEDLEAEGFKVGNRMVGLDREHCEMVLKKLATMHAASIHLNNDSPEFKSPYKRGAMYENMPETLTTYFTNGISQAVEVMKLRPNLQKYVKVYEEYIKRFIPDGIKLFKSSDENETGFNVLNHGDIWINNIMFKHDKSGKPIDVRFIDFQMSYLGCPGVDINYFLFTSPTEETRSMYKTELVASYQTALAEMLQKLQFSGRIPSADDVHRELLKSKDIGLMTVCIVLPLAKINRENSDKMTTEGIMDKNTESDSRQSLYSNELYQKSLESALKDLEDMEYL